MHQADLDSQLQAISRRNLYRRRRVIDGPQGVVVTLKGRRLLNFCSNDYLGLANHPEVVAATQRGAEHYGAGSGSAHLICGHSTVHHALEEELADFTGRERALLFSTGYMANLGAISALMGKGDCVFEDRLNHASLLDGGLLSGARFKRYPHADMAGLQRSLAGSNAGSKLIVSDGVFSMDGGLAPLPDLVTVSRNSGAGVLIDDAHGLGVLGASGRGTLEHFKLGADAVDVLVGTLGKAFGTFGAFVAGKEQLIEFLIQRARPYIYTTAIPPSIAEASRASLKIAVKESWRREKLIHLISRFRTGARELDLSLMMSATPIQPVQVGDSLKAVEIADKLNQAGLLVAPIRPPTVPRGSARLRITFSALHEESHVDRLLDAFSEFRV